MEAKAQQIADILTDYENNQMTAEHVLDWVTQFDEADQALILEELTVIFQKTYFSKTRCKQIIEVFLKKLAITLAYADVVSMLRDSVFLDLQEDNKSQKELLELLDEILRDSYGLTRADCGQFARHYIYLDDVLATGNKIYSDLQKWLTAENTADSSRTNLEFLKANQTKLTVLVICAHLWGLNNVEYRLMKDVGAETKKHIRYRCIYTIENNSKTYNAALNNMLPTDHLFPEAVTYLGTLTEANLNADRAYRKPTQPGIYEKLFSSAANRDRLETIFLLKGIDILNRVQNLNVKQHRPLGYTIKSHKTFGLGTLFFTYRNIPNNCPIVFWWGNNNWRPLFVLKNRGR